MSLYMLLSKCSSPHFNNIYLGAYNDTDASSSLLTTSSSHDSKEER